MLLADLENAERRLAESERRAGGGVRDARSEAEAWRAVVERLRAGGRAPRDAGLLTSKPELIVANVGEAEGTPEALAQRGAVSVCALDEAELGELDADEAVIRDWGVEPVSGDVSRADGLVHDPGKLAAALQALL
jgi:hypothetical protein